MNNQRVAIVCLSHFQGGMELDSIKQATIFNKNNIDTLLICKKNSFIEKKSIELNIPFESIDFKSKLSFSLVINLRRVLIEKNIETIIFFGSSEIKSIYFSIKGLSCRVIVRHGTTKSTKKKDILHRLFYSCVSKHIAISKHLAKNTLEIFPCNESDIATIYNTAGDNKHNEYFNHTRNHDFLFVGRVDKGKGAIDAIQALAKASLDKKKITFVGEVDAETRSLIESHASENHIHVKFTGFQSDVVPFYLDSKYLLFPSYGEGLPNVVLESIKYGLTCITYDNTVFPEFKSLGFKGFFISKNKDIDKLSENITKAVSSDYSMRADLETYDKFFSEKSFIEQWKKVL